MSLLGYPIEINHYQDFYHFLLKFTINNSIHYKLILIRVYLVYDLVVSIWIQAPTFVAQYLLVSRKKKKITQFSSFRNHNKELKLAKVECNLIFFLCLSFSFFWYNFLVFFYLKVSIHQNYIFNNVISIWNLYKFLLLNYLMVFT